jgi:hypothetical protein
MLYASILSSTNTAGFDFDQDIVVAKFWQRDSDDGVFLRLGVTDDRISLGSLLPWKALFFHGRRKSKTIVEIHMGRSEVYRKAFISLGSDILIEQESWTMVD